MTLKDALVSYGFDPANITVLLDGAASRAAILSGIADLQRAPEDARAIFTFAGHTRKVQGGNALVAADGKLISAGELAGALAKIRAPMWLAFPTCYAAGFDIPGIVGPNRIATFASSADQLAYEATEFGRSFLFQYMVQLGMLMEQAKPTVESAFEYARTSLARDYPDRVPLVDDQYPGEFLLAAPSWRRTRPPADPQVSGGKEQTQQPAPGPGSDENRAAPAPGRQPEQPAQPPDEHPGTCMRSGTLGVTYGGC